MFKDMSNDEYIKAAYARAQRLKPNADGVKAHQLGWVQERNGFTEVLVSFRGLEDIVNQFESTNTEAVQDDVEETEVDEQTEEVVQETVKQKRPRKVKTEVKEAEQPSEE